MKNHPWNMQAVIADVGHDPVTGKRLFTVRIEPITGPDCTEPKTFPFETENAARAHAWTVLGFGNYLPPNKESANDCR
nr:hypothetical protein [Methylocella tundrae]